MPEGFRAFSSASGLGAKPREQHRGIRALQFRFPLSFILHPSSLILCLLLSGCASSPRVLEVSSRTRLRNIDAADERMFMHDPAARIRYRPHDLPADQQREEFYVHWRGADVNLVKFEYRQVDVPNTIKEQTVVLVGSAGVESAVPSRNSENPPPAALGTAHATTGRHSHVFEIRGDDFHTGGHVSAWRVSLWSGEQLLAERKSALW
jgi:hypothetical protein